jgi:hypothetical protein
MGYRAETAAASNSYASSSKMNTIITKQRTNKRAVKLADLDWRKCYDKQTQEKLLAGLEI